MVALLNKPHSPSGSNKTAGFRLATLPPRLDEADLEVGIVSDWVQGACDGAFVGQPVQLTESVGDVHDVERIFSHDNGLPKFDNPSHGGCHAKLRDSAAGRANEVGHDGIKREEPQPCKVEALKSIGTFATRQSRRCQDSANESTGKPSFSRSVSLCPKRPQ